MRISGLCSQSRTVTIIISKIGFRFKPRSFCQHMDTGESRRVPRGAAWLANTRYFSRVHKQTLIATVVAVVGLASQRNTRHAPSLLWIKIKALVAVQCYSRMANTFAGSGGETYYCLTCFWLPCASQLFFCNSWAEPCIILFQFWVGAERSRRGSCLHLTKGS